MRGLLSLFLCSQFLFISLTSAALDTITTDKSIRDGDTIVSAGGIYELGFFSPGNSNKNRYVGIWYKKIAPRTVVWVANRDIPLNDTSGVLTLKPNGVLVLVDNSNISIWSSNSSRSLKNPKARLLDSANLVVSDRNDIDPGINYAWQSFDYPGNTLLPGMKMGKNLVTGTDWNVTSWKSTDDPTPGEYVNRVDSNGYLVDGVIYISRVFKPLTNDFLNSRRRLQNKVYFKSKNSPEKRNDDSTRITEFPMIYLLGLTLFFTLNHWWEILADV